MSPASARRFVELVLKTHREVGAVTIQPGTSNRVIQVLVDYERMTSWTERRLVTLNELLRERGGYAVRAEPSGLSMVPGLPDLLPGVQRKGPSFILSR